MAGPVPTGFQHLNLAHPILRAVGRAGYKKPTAIQDAAIPRILERRDLLGCAQTGSGKTAAFVLPILHRLAARNQAPGSSIFSLILSPTRELALQTGSCVASYSVNLPYRHGVIYGGVDKAPQHAMLQRGIDIMIATPGRLLDLMGEVMIDFRRLEVLVLDEADRMLDMGFIKDVERIMGALPQQRQTLFFSATMPPAIDALANRILRAPERVSVAPVASTVDTIDQCVYRVKQHERYPLLLSLMRDTKVERALLFVNTKVDADELAGNLLADGMSAEAIHSDKEQWVREAILRRFRDGRTRFLVATDVASRGLDVPEVSHVFNVSLPHEAEDYVHRIGRTARAGRSGIAISFCKPHHEDRLRAIEKLTGKKIRLAN